MTTTVSESPTTKAAKSGGGKVRGFISWLLVVVAGLLVPLAMVAFWGQRSVTDTERWVATVAPLAEDQAIRDQVANATSEAILKQIDNNTTIDDFLSGLPPRAQEALKTPIEAAINSSTRRSSRNSGSTPTAPSSRRSSERCPGTSPAPSNSRMMRSCWTSAP